MPTSSSESSVKRFGINAFSSVLTRLLSITVLVWVNQYLLRRIEPEEYSLFPLVMSLVVFNGLFVSIFVGGVSRHMVEAHHLGEPGGVTRVASSMLVVLVPATLFLGLVGGLAAWNIDALLEIDPSYLGQARIMFLLTVLTLCLTTLCAPLTQGLYVQERFVLDNLIGLGSEVLRILLLLTLLFALGTRVMWLVVASSTATLANQLAQLLLTRRLLPEARFDRSLVCRTTMKRVLSFGAWTSVHGISQLLSGTAPVLLLNRFASPLDVASFHAGRIPETQMRNMLQAIEGPAQPALIGLYARGGQAAVNQLYYRGGRYYLWLILLPVAPLLVFGRPLFRLYAGEEYAKAGIVMAAILGSYPFQFASGMYYRVAHAIGRIGAFHAYFLMLQLVAIAAILYAVGLRGEGAVGAAFAIGLTQGLLHVVLIWPMGLRLVGGRWSDFARRTIARGMLPFCAALVLSLAISRYVVVDDWWTLLAICAASAIVYAGVLLGLCLDAEDRALLARALRRLRLARPSPVSDEQVP